MVLWQSTVGFGNTFEGLFFYKQKGTRVFQWQKDINVVIIALSSTKPSQFFEKYYEHDCTFTTLNR